MPEISLNLFAPHEEAAAIIRGKPALAREVFNGLLPELRARAITVTGLQRLDQMERIRESIASIAEGKLWNDAKAEVTAELTAMEDGAERRAELLLRTHAFQAFQTSTWRSAQADRDTTHLQYLATEDARVRDSHLALNGLIFPKQDTFWHDHTPPWEWGCRCRIRALSVDDVADERTRDAQRNPEDRMVMDGPRAEKARQGDLVRGPQTLPDGSKTSGGQIDVTAPAKKRTEKTPYQYHPDNLRLSVNDLKARYAPEEWSQFEGWAKKTEVAPDRTVMEWLKGAGLPPASVTSPPPTPAPPPPVAPKAPEIVALSARLAASGFKREVQDAALQIPDAFAPEAATVKVVVDNKTETGFHLAGTIHMGNDPAKWAGRPPLLWHEFGHHAHLERGHVTHSTVHPEVQTAIQADSTAWRTANQGTLAAWKKAKVWDTVTKALGLKTPLSIADQNRVGKIADTIGALTRGSHGDGHKVSYYRKGNFSAMEAYANTLAAIIEGDMDYSRHFPNLVAAVRKLNNL